MAPQFWLWALILVGGFFVVYWRVAQGALESEKNRVMAKQRAVAQSLGPRIVPFRDRLEGWVQELAKPWAGPAVASAVSVADLSKSPGVYLRIRLKNAGKPENIRQAAARSLRDGFTSCLFVDKALKDFAQGPLCKTSTDCKAGELCNEWNVCKPPPSPYNLRLAYRAMRVLTSEWTDELHQAGSDLAVAGYDRDLDGVVKTDVPVAIDLLQRAKFFTVVLDEEPKGGLPKALPDSSETEEERLQRVPHMARVGIWNLETGEQVLRLRAEAAGKFVPVGKSVVNDPTNQAAQQRQANSCALALEVKRALTPKTPEPPAPPPPGSVPVSQ